MVGKIVPGDSKWPKRLNDLGSRAPKQLWYEGEWRPELFKKCVAVVGSRRITEYGKRVIEKLVPKLVAEGWIIVSGMMYGTDQEVHKNTMACGGKTIGVLGYGIKNKLLNDEEIKLVKKITDTGGLLISEWEDQRGTLWTFPQRDRIMAALASEIYVTEAAIKSGALITTDWARELGRKIWAVPGPIMSKVSEGTNELIRSKGGEIWTGEVSQLRLTEETKRSNIDTDIYNVLQIDTYAADEIARKLGRQVNDVGAKLSMMVLAGEVEERNGKYYNLG